MEDPYKKPVNVNYDRERERTDINKNDSCVNEETHKLNYNKQNIDKTVNIDDVKLKEKENKLSIKEGGFVAKNDFKDEVNLKIDDDDDSSYNGDVLKDIDALLEDDKDHLKNLESGNDDINKNESKTPRDSKNLHENYKIENKTEKLKDDSNNEDGIDAKTETNDADEADACSSEDKVFKKYRLRQRQSIRYTFDEPPPPKKKKVTEKEEDSKKDYVCPICYTTCSTKKGFSIHMVSHEQPEKYTCAQCAMDFPTHKELVNHKEVHEKDDTIFSCAQCKVAYSNMLEFLLHKADHKNLKEYNCEECGRVFEKRNLYKIHLHTHFITIHNCDICKKDFKNKIRYIQHTKTHTEQNKTYICGECGKVCKALKHYNYHMTTHTGVKLYQCLYCGKGFANTGQRKVHTRIHTGERPYQCHICQQTFIQFSDHKRHIFNHNSTKFICDFCGKEFTRKYSLEYHMRIHTREKLLSCPVCNKKFPLHALLKSHYIYNHTDKKPFKCDTCKVSFKRLNNLQRHLKLRKHTNNVYGLELKNKKVKEN